jgi:hypothetical protein
MWDIEPNISGSVGVIGNLRLYELPLRMEYGQNSKTIGVQHPLSYMLGTFVKSYEFTKTTTRPFRPVPTTDT